MRAESAKRELDWQALIETALTAPGSVGDTYNRFYNYSFLNQILLVMQGYSRGREIAINPVATDPLGTTFHECGHIVLGHTAPRDLDEYRQHRGVYEFQAEATSYLAMHELEQLSDVQASESRGYIQGWLRSERPTDVAIRQVFSATDKILRAGRLMVEVAVGDGTAA